MLDKVFQLSERERRFKSEYENGGQHFLEKPMSYQEYALISKEKKKDYGNIEHYHEEITTNSQGNTNTDFYEDGDYVEIVLHGRYSYPLMHNHAYIELVYVYSGSCVHFVEDQSFDMKTGDVCILAPNAMHAISAINDEAVIINIMMSKKMFDSSFLRMMRGNQALSDFFEHGLYNKKVSPYIIYPTGNDEWMKHAVLNMYKERKEKDYLYNESVTLYIKQMFIHLLRRYEMMAIISNPIDNTQESNIVALIGYITVNYNHVTLKSTAQFFGYNETYLGQILQKYTGKNFCTLLTEQQMKNAKRLLEESSLSVTEVGCEVGCYDSSHFIRKFKKMFGVTPSMWRKMKSNKE